MCDEKILNTDLYNPEKVSVHFYYDEVLEESSGMWYEDDGKTKNAFEKNLYQIVNFKYSKQKKYSSIRIDNKDTESFSKIKSFDLILHLSEDYKPKKAFLGKEKLNIKKATKRGILRIAVSFENQDSVEIKLMH